MQIFVFSDASVCCHRSTIIINEVIPPFNYLVHLWFLHNVTYYKDKIHTSRLFHNTYSSLSLHTSLQRHVIYLGKG